MRSYFIGSYKEKPTTGGHLYNSRIVEAIREMNHEVLVINVHQLPRFFKFKFTSFIYCLLLVLNKKPDLIIQVSDTALRYIIFSLLIGIFKIPVIQVVYHIENRISGLNFKLRLNSFLIKYNLKRAKKIIVISQNTKSKVLEYTGSYFKNKIIIINPGIETKYKRKKARNFRNKKFWNLLSIGAITERKGYYYLIGALQNLRGFPFKCCIVGEIQNERYYSFLLEKVKSYHLGHMVEFTGYTSETELLKLYNSSDLFILPSLHEGYGIVLCEAICHALPIIATDVGAVPEIIEDKKVGILIKPKSAKSIEKALRTIFSKPELAEELSQNAIEKCRHLQSWGKMKEQIKQFMSLVE